MEGAGGWRVAIRALLGQGRAALPCPEATMGPGLLHRD